MVVYKPGANLWDRWLFCDECAKEFETAYGTRCHFWQMDNELRVYIFCSGPCLEQFKERTGYYAEA